MLIHPQPGHERVCADYITSPETQYGFKPHESSHFHARCLNYNLSYIKG